MKETTFEIQLNSQGEILIARVANLLSIEAKKATLKENIKHLKVIGEIPLEGDKVKVTTPDGKSQKGFIKKRHVSGAPIDIVNKKGESIPLDGIIIELLINNFLEWLGDLLRGLFKKDKRNKQ